MAIFAFAGSVLLALLFNAPKATPIFMGILYALRKASAESRKS